MKKSEILKNYTVNKLDNNTVFIRNSYFNFSYTVANSIVREDLKDKYRYFGGIQCDYKEDSNEYKDLEKWLCEIAEKLI